MIHQRLSRRALMGSVAGLAGATLLPQPGWTAEAISEASFTAAADYSAERAGSAVLVARGAEILFERYDNGHGPDHAGHIHSATKSFWGVALMAMIEDGLADSIDEPAMATLPEWADDPRRARITLRMLLDLSSGLGEDVPALQGDRRRETWAADKYAHAITLPVLREPGSVFRYGPSHYYVLGEIIKRKLAARGQTPLEYLDERILSPIGCRYETWVHDDVGNPHIPNGCFITPRNWLAYGRLMMAGGSFEGTQILSADLLAQAFEPSAANPGIGLSWWLNTQGGSASSTRLNAPEGSPGGFIYHAGRPRLAAALGAGRNGLYLMPEDGLIVIRQANIQPLPDEERRRYQAGPLAFRDNAFLAHLFGTA